MNTVELRKTLPLQETSNIEKKVKKILVWSKGKCIRVYGGNLKIEHDSRERIVFVDENGNRHTLFNTFNVAIVREM